MLRKWICKCWMLACFLPMRNNCVENPNIRLDPLFLNIYIINLLELSHLLTPVIDETSGKRGWALGPSLGLSSTGHHGSACLVFSPGTRPVGTGNTNPGRTPVEEMEWEKWSSPEWWEVIFWLECRKIREKMTQKTKVLFMVNFWTSNLWLNADI